MKTISSSTLAADPDLRVRQAGTTALAAVFRHSGSAPGPLFPKSGHQRVYSLQEPQMMGVLQAPVHPAARRGELEVNPRVMLAHVEMDFRLDRASHYI